MAEHARKCRYCSMFFPLNILSPSLIQRATTSTRARCPRNHPGCSRVTLPSLSLGPHHGENLPAVIKPNNKPALANHRNLVIDTAITYELGGGNNLADVSLNGELRDSHPDRLLERTATTMIARYDLTCEYIFRSL